MKKLIVAIAFIAISTLAVQAQDKMSAPSSKKIIFSIGAEAGLPVGSAGISDIYSFALGGSLQGEYVVSPDFGLTLKAGYLHYLGKNGVDGNGLIPILAGFRYHFTPKVYASAQLGISLSTQSGGGSSFTYAPGLGFQLSRNFDVLARYEAASNNGFTIGNVGVRLAYSLN